MARRKVQVWVQPNEVPLELRSLSRRLVAGADLHPERFDLSDVLEYAARLFEEQGRELAIRRRLTPDGPASTLLAAVLEPIPIETPSYYEEVEVEDEEEASSVE